MTSTDLAGWIAQLGSAPHADPELWGLTRHDVETLAKRLPGKSGRKFVRCLQQRWLDTIAATPTGVAALANAEIENCSELWDTERADAEFLGTTLCDPQREAWLLGFLGFSGPAAETDTERALRLAEGQPLPWWLPPDDDAHQTYHFYLTASIVAFINIVSAGSAQLFSVYEGRRTAKTCTFLVVAAMNMLAMSLRYFQCVESLTAYSLWFVMIAIATAVIHWVVHGLFSMYLWSIALCIWAVLFEVPVATVVAPVLAVLLLYYLLVSFLEINGLVDVFKTEYVTLEDYLQEAPLLYWAFEVVICRMTALAIITGEVFIFQQRTAVSYNALACAQQELKLSQKVKLKAVEEKSRLEQEKLEQVSMK